MASLKANIGYSGIFFLLPVLESIIIFVFMFFLKKDSAPSNICSMLPSILLLSSNLSPISPVMPNSVPGITAQAINSWG